MSRRINISFLSHAISVIADTNTGLTGSKIIEYCNHFAIQHEITIPHALYPFSAGSKRIALQQNIMSFPDHVQYQLLIELCNDKKFDGDQKIREIIDKLQRDYEYLAPQDDQPNLISPQSQCSTTSPKEAAIEPDSPTATNQAENPPNPLVTNSYSPINLGDFEYDVAISFAGQDRQLAEEIVKCAKALGINIFLDSDQQSKLWGEELNLYLFDLYFKKSRFCLILVSVHYVDRMWPKHEWKAALAGEVTKQETRILPLRIDDTVLPGLSPTKGYLDIRKMTITQVVDCLREKLGASVQKSEANQANLDSGPASP